MSGNGWFTYSANAENLTLQGDTGDFFQLIGGANPYRILEAAVWQRGSTTIIMETVRFHRGTGGSGGSALVEHEYAVAGPAATTAALSLPTTDVGPTGSEVNEWIYRRGWNLLQEMFFLPIPALQVPFQAADDLGIAQESGTAHTGVGIQVVWEEFVGS